MTVPETPTDIETPADIETPPPGTRVTLLGQSDGRPYNASVMTWISSKEALVVSTRVAVDHDAVSRLADQRVWMSVPETSRGFTVFSGLAQPAGPKALDITGVALLLREPRRDSPRATVNTTVVVSTEDRERRQLRGVDLSRGGVRVAMSGATDVTLGEHVTVEVQLEDGTSLPATGQVIRLDPQAGQATVRFDELTSDEGAHVDRYVLLRLATVS